MREVWAIFSERTGPREAAAAALLPPPPPPPPPPPEEEEGQGRASLAAYSRRFKTPVPARVVPLTQSESQAELGLETEERTEAEPKAESGTESDQSEAEQVMYPLDTRIFN